nr:MAG TPA: hypothetical protein [Caudoviricetes sp.]
MYHIVINTSYCPSYISSYSILSWLYKSYFVYITCIRCSIKIHRSILWYFYSSQCNRTIFIW